jgi:ArsR family transcriptional regulator
MKSRQNRDAIKKPSRPAGAELEARAADVARLLSALANPRRLIILCRLSIDGECSVGALAQAVGLSQSALSQHLAVLREHDVVTTRRDGLNIFYSISDPRTRALMQRLEQIFCQDRDPSWRHRNS